MRVFLLACFTALLGAWACAQSPTGTVSGIVFDPDAKAVAGAEIILVNDLTRLQYETKTNDLGIYSVPNLPPGPYRVQASKIGFKTLIRPDITVNVQDSITVNFTLPVGATSIAITVEGGAPMINTTDASVSTVVDHTFVENMPLNGRSFQDLILLTPGVVTPSPQSGSVLGANGEFSVSGQRTESNNYVVDGVSANTGIYPGAANFASTTGALPASTALGTTQGLVSVDALQEFRVQTSSYSAQYGRNPGGQFSFVTRSGTNDWHGTGFGYVRNSVFDANNWFNDFYRKPQPALRQSDFGGVFGGPVTIPRVYKGRDKTFFFFSYEGLRLTEPQAATVNYVPTLALRQSSPQALQGVLNAFPIPNGADIGNGLAEYIGSWSNPSSVDVESLRLDHVVSSKLRLFFRFSNATSSSDQRLTGNFASPAMDSPLAYKTQTYTIGATSIFGHFSNDARLNYSSNDSSISTKIGGFGGGKALDLAQLQGVNVATTPVYNVTVALDFPGYVPELSQRRASGEQRQWNLVDDAGFSIGSHQLSFGIDYRRLAPIQKPWNPFVQYYFFGESAVEANNVGIGTAETQAQARPEYENFSAFVQDEWRLKRRLSLSMGLRYEVNPAPGVTGGLRPYTVENLGDLANLTLAPEGTPLWKTSWFNFAPRLGVAYILRPAAGFETVVRGGAGVFFDTGQQDGSWGFYGPGLSALNAFGSALGSPASFPLGIAQVTPVIINPPTTPYGTVYGYPAHLQLPYTVQTSLTLQQALGSSQAVTISYVGALGRRLLQENEIPLASRNPNFSTLVLFRGGLTSDYNALETQFRRRVSRGLQILASYTLSHSLDYGSNNADFQYVRGNSDFDVRHSFSAAVSYERPASSARTFVAKALERWAVDARATARTGFPVTLDGGIPFYNPATGSYSYRGLDLVPGVPVYLYGPQFPGGRAINPSAFTAPPVGEYGDAPRNFVRGFGAFQTDLAVRREFPIGERLKLQFRAESFNVFNHPNFGFVNSDLGSNLFGQATATLNQSLGVLSPLYQLGGPRSMQFAVRFSF